MTIGAKTPIVIVNSSMLRSFDDKEVETVLAHEVAHVLSEHYTYTTALVLLSQFLLGALPRSLLLGLPVRAMYLALLEWSRAAELSADRAAALVMADPLQPCRVLMALAGGSVPGMNFEAFLKQANEYESEDDLFSRHTRFWSELNLTHPVAVRRVKELMEWVQTGAYDRIRDGDYPRRGEEPPPSEEFEDAVAHYRERFARILDRAAGGVQELGRRLGSWLERWQNRRAGRRRGRRPRLGGTGAGTNRAPARAHLLPATSARWRRSSIGPKVTTAGDEEPQFRRGLRYSRQPSGALRVASRARLKGRTAWWFREQTRSAWPPTGSLFAHSSEGVLFCTQDGRITAANPAACAMLDMSAEEICALGRDGLVDQEDPRWDIAVAERERTGSAVGVARLRRGDGRFIEIEMTAVQFRDEDGVRADVLHPARPDRAPRH